ncbi:MAG: porin [Chitinophagaceae bacterium]
MRKILFITVSFLMISATLFSQDTSKNIKEVPAKKWYETFGIRGYIQFRYNRLFETNPKLKCEQCDKSWGENGGFFLRRVRVIFSGNISDNVFFYIQPDFASSVSATGLNFGQIRDAYFDVTFDKKKEFRVRLGQSKVPFGFENLQSSQNRIPLDRNDALNSSLANERDLGVFFMWAPKDKRALFSRLVNSGLKGSGDYGVFAFGFYNGQTANKLELNNSPHVVGRFTWPFELDNKQIIEASVQGYFGKYVMSDTTRGVKLINPQAEYSDQRIAASFILYPQPFGLQAEYNIGKGPQFNPAKNSIEEKNLSGGYILASYIFKPGKHLLVPFTRYQMYTGGKKHELDARSYDVKEFELGLEWQLNKSLEFVATYTSSHRIFEDAKLPSNDQRGRLLRLQAQLNF